MKPQLGCTAGISRDGQFRVLTRLGKHIQGLSPESILDCLGCVLRVIVLLEGAHSVLSEVLSSLDQLFFFF